MVFDERPSSEFYIQTLSDKLRRLENIHESDDESARKCVDELHNKLRQLERGVGLQDVIRKQQAHTLLELQRRVTSIEQSMQGKVLDKIDPEFTAESIHAGIRWGYRSKEIVLLLKRVASRLLFEEDATAPGATPAPENIRDLAGECRSAAKVLADEALG